MPIYRFAKRKPKSSMDELKIVYTFPDGILHASATATKSVFIASLPSPFKVSSAVPRQVITVPRK